MGYVRITATERATDTAMGTAMAYGGSGGGGALKNMPAELGPKPGRSTTRRDGSGNPAFRSARCPSSPPELSARPWDPRPRRGSRGDAVRARVRQVEEPRTAS